MTDENEIMCPRCSCEAYEHLEPGEASEIDTIGMHRVCATEQGTYLHGQSQFE
ncbi:hypothetical protein [Natrinema sp. 1APR25-10V2]|uniref:hypothetical protein n=1 Tax=Natrinema sp. 1APR25-10V2 TaxID=2951081 RepID=UPI002874D038|nr:hypothetical protein [Natrinema sp. 1APR25-10V2]MDS0473525.1 hypothetical protein [Natrinema sp. 1APR25-10V2]